MKTNLFAVLVVFILTACLLVASITVAVAGSDKKTMNINVLLNTNITDDILADLSTFGYVQGLIYDINVVMLKIQTSELDTIQALPYVEAANPDAKRQSGPLDTILLEDFEGGLSTWNLDAINVTDFGFDNRQVEYDGTDVYVAVLDTGLVKNWRQYFPQERIATIYAKSFCGGGSGGRGNVAEQPNKWEKDTCSHGTHVTSTIIGYSLGGVPINGVAPKAKIIPVKVLNNNGMGWSSVIAQGIVYIVNLKKTILADYPVVINMSLGGPGMDAAEEAGIEWAISEGVIIVASAGNEGEAGMEYPGAYEPVISVAASGWTGEWQPAPPPNPVWWIEDLPEPTDPDYLDYFYITPFSSRELTGQDLDIAAPGSWVMGPLQFQMGKISYYFGSGTSMASAHVAGIVALMAQKYNALTAGEAEDILVNTAVPLGPGCRWVYVPIPPWEGLVEGCWGTDATGAGLADADAALNAIP